VDISITTRVADQTRATCRIFLEAREGVSKSKVALRRGSEGGRFETQDGARRFMAITVTIITG